MHHPPPSRKAEIIRYVAVISFTTLGFLGMDFQQSLLRTVLEVGSNLLAVVAALIAMHWRRKYPVPITVTILVASVFLPMLWGIAGWAYLSLCTHRRWPATLGVGIIVFLTNLLGIVYTEGGFTLYDEQGVPREGADWLVEWTAAIVLSGMVTVTVAAIGSYLGARRDARAATAERLAAAERERALAEENSRIEERSRIAREMHDVLAHKISLVAMHAGALAYREDLSRDETREAARTIQESAHLALEELRAILGDLRQVGDGGASKPQPTLSSLEELIDEHRQLGHDVVAEIDVVGEPSQSVGRHAYRIVQEGLTNAAKHARGTQVRLKLHGDEDNGISIRISNPLSLAPSAAPGAGLGLIGLEERAELAGGSMSAGPREQEFVMEVWLPW